MLTPQLQTYLQTVLNQLSSQSEVASGVLDLDLYQIQIALLWIQITAAPEDINASEDDLEAICDYMNDAIQAVLGEGYKLRQVFAYLGTHDGDMAMQRLKLKSYQKDLIDYFGTMITDPDEHQRRMRAARSEQQQSDG